MTREEAIENLKELLECSYVDKFEDAENEALEMAIKALKQESCEDAISRTDLIRKLQAWDAKANGIPNYAWGVIKELPSVTPKEKTGHWIRHDNGKYHWYLCSCCDAMAGSDEKRIAYKYCPNCGARMESET